MIKNFVFLLIGTIFLFSSFSFAQNEVNCRVGGGDYFPDPTSACNANREGFTAVYTATIFTNSVATGANYRCTGENGSSGTATCNSTCEAPSYFDPDLAICLTPEGECVDFVWSLDGTSCGCPPSGDCSGVPNLCTFPAVPDYNGDCVAPVVEPFPVIVPQSFFDDGYGPVVGPNGDIFEPVELECTGGICVGTYSDTGRDVDTSGYPENGIGYDDTYYGFDGVDENGFPDYENNPFVDPSPFDGDVNDLDNIVPVIPPVTVQQQTDTAYDSDGSTTTDISSSISPDGSGSVTETVTRNNNDGSSSVTETTTTYSGSGSTTNVVVTETDSEGNVSVSGSGSTTGECVGPACETGTDYSGAASSSCDVTPSCDRSEAECQIIMQEFRSMCYVDDYVSGDEFYSSDSTNTFESVADGTISGISTSANMAAIDSFFTLDASGSSCPIFTSTVPFVGELVLDQWCSPSIPWAIISGVILFAASVISFRIAVG